MCHLRKGTSGRWILRRPLHFPSRVPIYTKMTKIWCHRDIWYQGTVDKCTVSFVDWTVVSQQKTHMTFAPALGSCEHPSGSMMNSAPLQSESQTLYETATWQAAWFATLELELPKPTSTERGLLGQSRKGSLCQGRVLFASRAPTDPILPAVALCYFGHSHTVWFLFLQTPMRGMQGPSCRTGPAFVEVPHT